MQMNQIFWNTKSKITIKSYTKEEFKNISNMHANDLLLNK